MAKFKITKAIEDLIQKTVPGFPEMQIYDNGKPKFRNIVKHKFFDEFTPEEQARIPGGKQYLEQKIGGQIVKREKMVPYRVNEAVCVNHVIELRKLYEQKGPKAFELYIDWVNKMIDKHNMPNPKVEVPNVEEEK